MDKTIINGFSLENPHKLDRVINGTPNGKGVMVGGIGEDADENLVLAHYDRVGGFIKKDGVKIKTGSFWDFKGNKPWAEPQILFLYSFAGETLEVADPSELSKAILNLEKTKEQLEQENKGRKEKANAKKLIKKS